MRVKNVILDPQNKAPVVILESVKDQKVVPIWIDIPEARSIALELEQVVTPRPLTHDLIRNIFQGLGVTLQSVTITELKNSTYFANLTLKHKDREFQVDSRPSDAIAIALRMKAPIYASSQVVAKAQQSSPAEENKGHLRKTMGIHIQDLTSDLASLFALPVSHGVLVSDVDAGSPGAKAGLQRGDVILRVNDRPLRRSAELESVLKAVKKPAQVNVEILRDGKTLGLALNIGS
jgi:bifunctional DNase/RNase